MDLNTIVEVAQPASREAIPPWQPGDAWLGGGTWLFSEPQRDLRRLIDLQALNWEPLHTDDDGLTIAATCEVGRLAAFDGPADWIAQPLIGQCCDAFWASHKVRHVATVGGNVCHALPAAPMIALTVALDGIGELWTPDGGRRHVAISDLIDGPGRTTLVPGALLRAIALPAAALRRHTAFRRTSLTRFGRSAALVIGTRDTGGSVALTVTAATPRPIRLDFDRLPDAALLAGRLDAAIPADGWYDDVHGSPAWRRHVTGLLAAEVIAELAGTVP